MIFEGAGFGWGLPVRLRGAVTARGRGGCWRSLGFGKPIGALTCG
jgi:hypothetical protein